MTSVAVIDRPRRVPFDRANVKGLNPLDRSLDREKLSWALPKKRAAREFLMEFSTLDALKSCSSIYLTRQRTWNRCEHPLCPTCPRLRAFRAAADLRRAADGYPLLIAMTPSLSSTPSTPLRDLWDGLDRARDIFQGNRWLAAHVAGFRWYTELAHGAGGWNPHRPYLLALDRKLDPARFENYRQTMQGRWGWAAAKAGFHVDPALLYFEPVLRTPAKLISYTSKGPMAQHGDSRTAGDIFNAAALDHDAEAAADWLEIEEASEGRRWQGTGGSFRRHAGSTNV